MFFKSKASKVEPSVYDCGYIKLWNEVTNEVVTAAAIKVITARGAAKLYPPGADKNAAIKQIEKVQDALLCAIGHYDGALAELRRYWNTHREDLVKCSGWNPNFFPDSHKIVESAYYNYFAK